VAAVRRRTLFFLGLSGLAGCSRPGRRLYVYNWSDYVAEDTVPNFEKEFGIEVRYSVYESNEELLAKVFGGNSGWDVVFPSNYFIPPMREQGLLLELDHARLPNLANLALQHPPWDPRLEVSAPYMLGSAGILYDPKQTGFEPESWHALWDARLRGRITMLDDPADTIGAALKKVGLPLNETAEGNLLQARAELIAQKPLVRAYLNAESRDQVIAGDLAAAHLWATTSAQAIDTAGHLRFVYPREGFAQYADNAVILRESKHSEAAHAFVNYLLRAETGAAIAEYSRTATPNAAARELLPPEQREDAVLYPPPETAARGEFFATLPAAAQRLRDRIWTEVKSA
jgi:spermidine/putrescine transport system substrate-binding protein